MGKLWGPRIDVTAMRPQACRIKAFLSQPKDSRKTSVHGRKRVACFSALDHCVNFDFVSATGLRKTLPDYNIEKESVLLL